jgi:hypothetical protein
MGKPSKAAGPQGRWLWPLLGFTRWRGKESGWAGCGFQLTQLRKREKSFPFTNLFIKSNPISIQMNFKLWRVPIRKIKYKITHQHKIKYKITHQHKIKYKITHQHKIKYAAV